jgi:hypothetical protein
MKTEVAGLLAAALLWNEITLRLCGVEEQIKDLGTIWSPILPHLRTLISESRSFVGKTPTDRLCAGILCSGQITGYPEVVHLDEKRPYRPIDPETWRGLANRRCE